MTNITNNFDNHTSSIKEMSCKDFNFKNQSYKESSINEQELRVIKTGNCYKSEEYTINQHGFKHGYYRAELWKTHGEYDTDIVITATYNNGALDGIYKRIEYDERDDEPYIEIKKYKNGELIRD